MILEKHICYEALKTRDARFDGQFFTGVKTTGIFCRPICPAQTPKEENCDFYESADHALAAGFRPCLRCRPESAPQSAAWMGTQAVVNRAVRLINEGALDGDKSLEVLASRLGMGERQLRRLFQQHLGISPIKVAQTKRLMFAKKLLKETDLSVTNIALSSGFQSVRRFNDAFKKAFNFTPSHERKIEAHQKPDKTCTFKLSYRPPFDWQGLLNFFQGRALDQMETVDENTYSRVVKIDDKAGRITVQNIPENHHLHLTIEGLEINYLRPCVERVRRLFDLDCDPLAIQTHLIDDPLIGKEVQLRAGLRLPGAWDGFEIAVRAIVGQQISVKAARTILSRLIERSGQSTEFGIAFPSPGDIAKADLNGIGLTRKRMDVLKSMCENWTDLDFGLPVQKQIEKLCKLNGIGPWTAHYIAMRATSHPDTFPINDLALLRKFQDAGLGETHNDVTRHFENYRPWRAYAALYVWQKD